MRKSCSIVLVLVAALIAASARPALSATTIDKESVQTVYAPGTPFSGYLKVVFDTPIPADSQLKVSIRDSTSAQSLSMQPYLSGVSYQYKQYAFTYNITAQGASNWYEYPEKAFWYRLSAEGTCGNQGCDSTGSCDCADLCGPSPSYPCYWSIISRDMQSKVNAWEGLKFIFDAAEDIAPPFSANSDTRWLQVIDTAIQYGVQTTMRMACGNSDYMGQATQPNGWVKRTLQGFVVIPGGTRKKITIESFDESSLTTDRQKFVEGGCSQPYACGGIYAGSTHLTSGFTANGTTGEIIFDNIVSGTTYIVVYLPPSGPFLCAYTSSKNPKSQSWSSASLPQQASVSYNTPFSKSYSESQLPYVFNDSNRITAFVKPPECLAGECQQTVSSYSAAKNPDSTGATIQVSFNTQSRTVSAITSSQEITQKYIKVDVSSFTKLKAPSDTGVHTLDVVLLSSGSEIASQEIPFTVCEDKDGDGYCKADDCNDSNRNLNPGMKELCNGIDEDCDGQIDEDFHQAGRNLGTACGVGACAGKWVCKPDGTDVMCSGQAARDEICSNKIDDDCDGVVDEDPGCRSVECEKDETRPCGSNVGECSPGRRICISGNWSEDCFDSTGPFEETCNNKDDDCDGIEDDLYEGTSAEETACGCYGTGEPGAEACDSIDNDCNGLIDDGIKCCAGGQTRECGIKKGICTKGTQLCLNGQWEQKCTGGIKPNPAGEICYNGLDDNCNGQIDEKCIPSFTCHNGKQDTNEEGVDCGGPCPESCGLPYNWMLFAGGVILLILAIALLEMRGSI